MIDQEKNRNAIAQVAIGLAALKDAAVFVGGAIVSLYADDAAVAEIRITEDIDVAFQVKNYPHEVALNETLQRQKFNPDPHSKSIVRHTFQGIPVDIITDGKDSPFNGTNKWYHYGFNDIRRVAVNGQEIQLFSPAIFIATKFEAFKDRGRDYRTSRDIEDILYVMQNNSSIVSEILNTHKDVLLFIREELIKIVSHSSSDEILSANMDRLLLAESLPLLKKRIDQITQY